MQEVCLLSIIINNSQIISTAAIVIFEYYVQMSFCVYI